MEKTKTNVIIMRRVRTIHRLRPLLSNTFFASLVFVVSLYALGREVWVARVFENMPTLAHVDAVGRFFLSAFLSTDFIVQSLTLLSFIALLWMTREFFRLISEPRAYFA